MSIRWSAPSCWNAVYVDKTVWGRIAGQQRPVIFMKRLIESGRLAHAYLFLGPDGVGRRAVAVSLAAALNCKRGACGSCPSCLRILNEADRAISIIKPKGRQVAIEQIRELQKSLALNQGGGEWRVVVIDPADAFSASSGNALLKSLEEPPPRTIFVLLATSLSGVLPTIRSRCQVLRFARLSSTDLQELLVFKGITPADAGLYARCASGRADRALALAGNQDLREWRSAFFRALASLVKHEAGSRQTILNLAKEAIEARIAESAVVAEQSTETAREFLAGRGTRGSAGLRTQSDDLVKRAKDKASAAASSDLCELIDSWTIDLLLIKEGGDEQEIANPDALESLHSAAATGFDHTNALEALRNTQEVLGYNVDETQAFESLFLRFSHPRR